MKALLKRLTARYTVTVSWDGDTYTHLATSLSDALSWLASYPRGSAGYVNRNLNGMFVAGRVA